MFKTKRVKPVVLALMISSVLGCASTKTSIEENITLESVSQDVIYLASDELNGRGNFSKEINLAANYISARFKDIGLSEPSNTKNFHQVYKIKRITPASLAVTINSKTFNATELTMASTVQTIDWNNNSRITQHIISKDENMRSKLSEINQQGGQHLVLIDPSHEKMFKRYQSYFNHGLTKLSAHRDSDLMNQGGTIIIVLTNMSKLSSFSVQAKNNISETALANVVGILPGKSKPNEIVLYSAHYDHLGANAQASSGDKIFNGADDDASGTSAIINLAAHFAKEAKNERTLMFAAFSAEEIGGFGSRYFSQQLNPDNITAMINIEMIGKPSKYGAGTVWMTGMERSNLGEQLNNALAGSGMKIHADPYPKQNLFYRSDNATLARLGVPAHSFSSTQLDKDQHYHQVSDDINSLDLRSMHKVVQALAIATTPLVDASVTPSRIDKSLVNNNGLIY